MYYHRYLDVIAEEDVRFLKVKDTSYGGSWAQRGGVGAFMMWARKWDRLENMCRTFSSAYDIFKLVASQQGDADGTAIAEIRDLRRYLLITEAYLVHYGHVHIEVVAVEPVDDPSVRSGLHGCCVTVCPTPSDCDRLRRCLKLQP